MIIANPIYDTTFKRLLENNRVAKFLIGTILDCKVLTLEPTILEHTKFDGDRLTLYRKDFAATIETKEGVKRVIIEMQKAQRPEAIGRFREYLGGEYAKSNYPIIAIYILGFNLSASPAAFVAYPELRDLSTNEKFHSTDRFVEHLTHKSYFVQTLKIEQKLNTKLDMLLSVFQQANFVNEDKTMINIPFETNDPDMKELLNILYYVAVDEEARKELDAELYYQRYVEQTFGEKDAIIAKKDEEIEENRKEIEKLKKLLEALKK
jgi:hypothetical protein